MNVNTFKMINYKVAKIILNSKLLSIKYIQTVNTFDFS